VRDHVFYVSVSSDLVCVCNYAIVGVTMVDMMKPQTHGSNGTSKMSKTSKKNKKNKKCKISLSKWNRGARYGSYARGDESVLLNSAGGMCCLGFYGEQVLGYSREQMLHESMPDESDVARDSDIAWGDATVIVRALIDANDDSKMSDERRRSRIKSLFTRLGVDIRYVK
jgi:hypothetical protein